MTYLKKKVFNSIFKKVLGSLYSFTLWFCLGGGDAVHACAEMLGRRGGAIFLLKCHALCPICLTFLVVHFYTHIYVSILNLCSILLYVDVCKTCQQFWYRILTIPKIDDKILCLHSHRTLENQAFSKV